MTHTCIACGAPLDPTRPDPDAVFWWIIGEAADALERLRRRRVRRAVASRAVRFSRWRTTMS